MRFGVNLVTGIFPLYVGIASGDRYADNQNPTVVDSPKIALNFPNLNSITLLSPAFTDPGSIAPSFANGTSGPTSQRTLGTLEQRLA